ncbi:hypothetical protein GCM10009851_33400 [Herbiconiux moechotypicola]|uniref:Uncharacterized protein n=1 Tax=Herbiconiux moechotypicola TaxID=637393 RepID=A0ABN3E026_9MICO
MPGRARRLARREREGMEELIVRGPIVSGWCGGCRPRGANLPTPFLQKRCDREISVGYSHVSIH